MSNKTRRDNLFQKDPTCYYCGVTTIHPSRIPKEKRNPKDTPKMATLEHLKTKWHLSWRGKRTVLACAGCNQARQQEIDQKMQQKLKEKGVKQPSPRIARELGVTP